jgi:hypothetical protein
VPQEQTTRWLDALPKTHLAEDAGFIGEQVRRLLRISEARTAADMGDKLEFLSNWSDASALWPLMSDLCPLTSPFSISVFQHVSVSAFSNGLVVL